MAKEIVEINGTKFEVDLDSARRITEFKVGDCVKVLVKRYSDTWDSHAGTVIGFDAFANLPTINLCYMEISGHSVELKFVSFNKQSKDIEIAPMAEKAELRLSRERVTDLFEKQIQKKKLELEEATLVRDNFMRMFGSYFTPSTIEKTEDGDTLQ